MNQSILSGQDSHEIDLKLAWIVLWRGRKAIVLLTSVFAILSVLYAISLPNQYSARIVLAPAQAEGGSGFSGMASQYGGLASLAGINLGNGTANRLEQALEVLNNWPFLDGFVQRHQLSPFIMAVRKWNKDDNLLEWDEELYDVTKKEWTVQDDGERAVPSSYQVYKRFSKMVKASLDAKSGFLTVEVEFVSPTLAYEWVNLLVHDINQHFQQIDINESRKNIEYLNNKINETSITEMQSVFYNLIEAQTKSLMLAEVSDQYLVKAIVPAMLPEVKSKPRRALICFIGTFLGFLIGVAMAFILFIRSSKL